MLWISTKDFDALDNVGVKQNKSQKKIRRSYPSKAHATRDLDLCLMRELKLCARATGRMNKGSSLTLGTRAGHTNMCNPVGFILGKTQALNVMVAEKKAASQRQASYLNFLPKQLNQRSKANNPRWLWSSGCCFASHASALRTGGIESPNAVGEPLKKVGSLLVSL